MTMTPPAAIWIPWGVPRPGCWLASVFGRPDIPIDETRYVSVAWEMGPGRLARAPPERRAPTTTNRRCSSG